MAQRRRSGLWWSGQWRRGVDRCRVAADSAGKVWTANAAASSLSRIDPRLGPIGADGVTPIGGVDLTVDLPGANPYNYSDMTGALALGNTSPQGTWQVIQDAGVAGAAWGIVTWNLEAAGSVPAGAELRSRPGPPSPKPVSAASPSSPSTAARPSTEPN